MYVCYMRVCMWASTVDRRFPVTDMWWKHGENDDCGPVGIFHPLVVVTTLTLYIIYICDLVGL